MLLNILKSKPPDRWLKLKNGYLSDYGRLVMICQANLACLICLSCIFSSYLSVFDVIWIASALFNMTTIYGFEGYQEVQMRHFAYASLLLPLSTFYGRTIWTLMVSLRVFTSDKIALKMNGHVDRGRNLKLLNGDHLVLTEVELEREATRLLEGVPIEFTDNKCGWTSIFEKPSRAQLALGNDGDGMMSMQVIRRLIRLGHVEVFTRNGRLIMLDNKKRSRNRDFIRLYADENHLAPVTSLRELNLKDMVNVDDVDLGPFGVLLPRPLPKRNDRSTERDQLFRDTEVLKELICHDGPLGRMAECALIAGMEELDVMNALMSKLPMDQLSDREIGRTYLTNPDWRVYNCTSRRWIGKRGYLADDEEIDDQEKPNLGRGILVWDGYKFLYSEWSDGRLASVKDEDGRVRTEPTHLLYLSDLPYRRGRAFIDRFFEVKSLNHKCQVILEEGVPSCGKTTNICTRAKGNDLITLPGRAGAAEYVERGKSARTLDSITVTGWNDSKVDTLWVDEGLLTHCGAIEMAIQMIKPDVCRVFGDRNQIGFIPRVNKYELLYREYPWSGEPVYHPNAYRNPKVVCDLLRPLYPNGYQWSNDVIGSLESIHIASIESVKPGHTVYLTYTKAEKKSLIKEKAGLNVMTIHEAQGLRFENVAIVRLKINDLTIYNSRSHNIVAVSRGWKFITYYTVRPGDLLDKWLTNGVNSGVKTVVRDEALLVETYKYNGGNYTPIVDRVVSLNHVKEGLLYQEWCEMAESVVPNFSPEGLAFVMRQPVKKKIKWLDKPAKMCAIETIQCVYDNLFIRKDKDVAMIERCNWPPIWPKGMRMDMVRSSAEPNLKPRPAIHPCLETTQPGRALRHQLDLARAFEKRVVDPPKQKLDYAPERAMQLFECFKKCVNVEYIEHLNLVLPNDCQEMKILWFNTRGQRKQKNILSCQIETTSGSKYYVIVRADHKPPLDGRIMEGVPGGQLVTAMHPFWNSIFASPFQVMLIKVLAALKPNIIFNTRMTWEELDAHIDSLLSGKTFKILELDISKYDKSQEGVWLEAQCLVFKLLGMSDDMIDLWKVYHEICVLTAPKFGVTYRVGFQRRSGDALTWFGNTLVLLMMMAYLYPIWDAYLVLLGGDDNVTAFKPNTKLKDQSSKAAEELNFELKPLCMNTSMYFSSRFIICTSNGWITVADPVKLITRLGRNDLQGDEHIKAIWDSWRSLHYVYLDPEVRKLLNDVAIARYSRTLSKEITTLMPLIESIAAIVKDRNEMKRLYYGTADEWALTLDPYEKVGGGLYEKLHDVFTDI